jgi:integrase
MIAFLFRPSRGGKKSKLWSAKVRLDEWAKVRVFPLHVTDKRVAQHKLEEIVQEHERESVGIVAPRAMRTAAQKPLVDHLNAFLADVVAKQRSTNTEKAYRRALGKLFQRCGWRYLREITPRSFVQWRSLGEVSPKYANDLLGYMFSLLNWLVRQNQLLANPLREVEKITIKAGRGHRRALSAEEIQRLLAVVPPHRATVYLMAIYTGLRRRELNGLT